MCKAKFNIILTTTNPKPPKILRNSTHSIQTIQILKVKLKTEDSLFIRLRFIFWQQVIRLYNAITTSRQQSPE